MRAYWAALFGFLVLRIDLLMVKYMKGATEAGYYSVAATMTDYLGMLPVVIGTVLFPKVAGLPDLTKRLQLTQKAATLTALMMLPAVLVAALCARPLVGLLFGSAFLPSSDSFVLLLPGIFFLSVEVVLVQFLNSVGFPKSVVVIWIFTCAVNIGLNLWAIPRYGMNGASVVSSLTYCLAFLLVALLTRDHWRKESRRRMIEKAA
jgi:O-antigen/teichoic acid export membrane protein